MGRCRWRTHDGRASLHAVRHDPTAFSDLRWMVTYCVYGLPAVVVIPLWIAGILVDGVWCGLLGRNAVVLPLISRAADLDAEWSRRLLQPPPKALLAARVPEQASAELRHIVRNLVVTERAVSRHIGNVFQRLGLPPADRGHRRVPTVPAYLENA